MEQSADDPTCECEYCDFGIADEVSESGGTFNSAVPEPVAEIEETSTSASPKLFSDQRPSLQKALLPNELLLAICDLLETEALLSFAEAWPKIGEVINKFNVIRTRELRCFCLKDDYNSAKLGIGVAVTKEEKGNMDFLS